MTKDTSPVPAHPTPPIAYQEAVRLPLPLVEGHKEYREREATLRRIDELLVDSGVESSFVSHHVALEKMKVNSCGGVLSDRRLETVSLHARRTLRCMIASLLSNSSYRDFSNHLAESSLLQWFCHYNMLAGIRPPSKSTLQRMSESTSSEVINQLMRQLVGAAQETDEDGRSTLGLAQAIDLSCVWIDTTCAALNIHFPTDWVLLRDGVRSIMRTIATIRSHGLFHRMPDPASIVRSINGLAMAMSSASRRGRGCNKKRQRKQTLRAMKKVANKAIQHAERYSAKVRSQWQETDLTDAQKERLANRLDEIVALMPQAIHQAHERIIGERPVPNAVKILSLYQPHAKVYVRGKSGADTEFGLQLLVAESVDGLILDCTVTADGVANDTKLLVPTMKRLQENFGSCAPTACVTDRGFSSASNSQALDELGIEDHTFPRSMTQSNARLADDSDDFAQLQRRRAQTEARIGVFKANFLGSRIPVKSLKAQLCHVAWSTLAHNVWVLARRDVVEESEDQDDPGELRQAG